MLQRGGRVEAVGRPREAEQHTSLTLVGIELTSRPGPHVVEGGLAPSIQTFFRAAVFWANSLVLVARPMVQHVLVCLVTRHK